MTPEDIKLRDELADSFMKAYVRRPEPNKSTAPGIAELAYSVADAMLAERAKRMPAKEEPKPSVVDWSTAPEWARFHAYDASGSGWWYSSKPIAMRDDWYADESDIEESRFCTAWRDTLEARP